MGHFSTISSKGQLTVPQEIRKRLGLEAAPKRLPADFVIASHALLKANRLMTRDASRYSLDFPKLHLL